MTKQPQQFGRMTIDVFESPDQHHIQAGIEVAKEKELKMMAMTAAFCTHFIAQRSNLGYEKTLETLTEETMKYKIIGVRRT